MKCIGGCCQITGEDTSPFPPGFSLMLIEVPKNIGKSRDESYPTVYTDQKTSSILVPTRGAHGSGSCRIPRFLSDLFRIGSL